MYYIGIDPGKSGGYSIINGDNGNSDNIVCKFWDQESFKNDLIDISNSSNACIACIENVHAMPSDSRCRAFSFGESYGYIKGVLEALKIPYQEISPMKWKKEFNLIKKDKSESIKMCKQLYPSVSLKKSDRCKNDYDGMAESLLMATYALRKFGW